VALTLDFTGKHFFVFGGTTIRNQANVDPATAMLGPVADTQ
jgi:hypothetical protein